MIKIKSKLSLEEKNEVNGILQNIVDAYGDFYITQNNLRLFIRDNLDLIHGNLDKGDKIAYDNEGVALLVGYSDNSPRIYLKILAKTERAINDVARTLVIWNAPKEDVFAKFKKTNPAIKILKRLGFVFVGGRGKEVLLVKKAKTEVE